MPSSRAGLDNEEAVKILNRILELELAGVVRYMHYSFMIFGHNRIPITGWLRGQASESLAHAVLAGEHVTSLGGHPSLRIGELLETHKQSTASMTSSRKRSPTRSSAWRSTASSWTWWPGAA
jgi:bacterioferritin